MTILALDIATKCGWCLYDIRNGYRGGTWNLSVRKRKKDPDHPLSTPFKLSQHLRDLYKESLKTNPIELVSWELVQFSRFRLAYASFCRLEGIVYSFCAENNLEYQTINTASLKKFVGSGKYQKEDMLREAQLKWPDWNFVDDNEVDARWVANYIVSSK